MLTDYNKFRYDDNLGYRILHTEGTHAGESTLTYPHYSLGFMLIYFRRGTGDIKVEGRHYNINRGDIIIIDPSELYQFNVDDSQYHERIVITLNEALFKDFPHDCSCLFSPFHERKKGEGNRISAATVEAHGIGKTLDDILSHVSSSEPASTVLTFCKIVELLSQLSKAVVPPDAPISEQINLHPLINEVLNFLELHFKEDIDITSIAAAFNIDKSYLSHLFKEHVGMSLWTYVILRRIQLFNRLIRHNNSVEETCYQAGFQNYSNFFRLYKKYMKMTPTEFKKQIKSKYQV